jgi:regulator of sigma E protease
MTLLAIDWSSVAVKTGQFILSFSILVVLHEMGHFFPAKWFKCRVEKFFLFFNPYFSLWKKKVGETEYGLGWVPFGGYVKISGMVDESMDKEQLKKPAEPHEFRSKPAWQRLIIMVGGVFVNIVLAIVLFIMIMYVWGEEYLPQKTLLTAYMQIVLLLR